MDRFFVTKNKERDFENDLDTLNTTFTVFFLIRIVRIFSDVQYIQLYNVETFTLVHVHSL